jgi:hypothetical protein
MVDEACVQQTSMRLHVESPFAQGATPAHLEQIAAAKRTGGKIRQGVIVARISAWTTLIFAIGTLLTSLTSLVGLVLGIGMAIVSIVEFKGGTALRCLDRAAPRRLMINQIAFGCMLFLYAAICLWTSRNSPSLLARHPELNDPQLREMLAPFQDLERTIYTAVYGAMMVAAIIGPGLAAWFYSTRTKHVDRYLRETPKWIIELQQAGMSL